ncbi:Hypothetical predicted protein [Lecanosticta acicola]|uniref:Uncharacterized protein n=1 Tax=Lecanosticta acicola TaxID=111012 RepID=A0AAI8Z2J2_9PEZI|nr:Hypothetical predicted protein [Lecanosticta acicola]
MATIDQQQEQTSIRIVDDKSVEIRDSKQVIFKYTFKNTSLLEEARTLPYGAASGPQFDNRDLAMAGDGLITRLIQRRWRQSARPRSVYLELYQFGMQSNAYMAHIADQRGLIENCMKRNGLPVRSADVDQHTKGDSDIGCRHPAIMSFKPSIISTAS